MIPAGPVKDPNRNIQYTDPSPVLLRHRPPTCLPGPHNCRQSNTILELVRHNRARQYLYIERQSGNGLERMTDKHLYLAFFFALGGIQPYDYAFNVQTYPCAYAPFHIVVQF